MNHLIACGGTGAHVSMAIVRLHMLGYPLGLFRDAKTDQPFEFPDLYLVDQDSGDGIGERTAWQAVRNLIERHPGQYDWKFVIGREGGPKREVVSPLPLGKTKEWHAKPYSTLYGRFRYSSMLRLFASTEQRLIDYSLGMMGSPAVGSLLFELKKYDLNPKNVNHDRAYATMRRLCCTGRVVVTGSGVGGTGASVAPTLARQCAQAGANVMAVMIQRWFELRADNLQRDKFDKAVLRNTVMEENAATGLASYGQDLAKNAAAVLVGVPRSALSAREFTSDNQQPIKDSYVHAIAALSAMQHFMKPEPVKPGLYGMSASDPTQLTGDVAIGDHSLQNLADRAHVFVYLLQVFAKVLARKSTKPKEALSKIYRAVEALVESPKAVGEKLERLLKDYRDSLEWLVSLGVEKPELNKQNISEQFAYEAQSRKRLSEEPLTTEDNRTSEQIALVLFHWTADWIRTEWKEGLVYHRAQRLAGSPGAKGYWPEQRATGLAMEWGLSGHLASVQREKILDTLAGFYDSDLVSQNGWPHPIAAAQQFRFQIQSGTGSARRKLELLLAGLATDELQLKPVEESRHESGPTLERLLGDLRQEEFHGLARFKAVRKRDNKVFGFNSPHTLICPVPDLRDDDWRELWCDLTGSTDGREWGTSDSWGLQGEQARGCVSTWIDGLSRHISPQLPPWAEAMRSAMSAPFGIGTSLQVYWGTDVNAQLTTILLPSVDPSSWHNESLPFAQDCNPEEFITSVPEFENLNGFSCYKEFRTPDREEPLRVIWKEHLDALQRSSHIYGWRIGRKKDQLEIFWDLDRKLVLRDTRVLDEAAIRIPTCIPLAQHHVPESARRDIDTQYPDLPILPEYIGLILTDTDEDLVGLLVGGVTDEQRLRVGSKPMVGADSVTWTFRVKGRADRIRISIAVDDRMEQDRVRAHWMIWPGFRALPKFEPWSAYYVYAHSTRPSLEVRTLFANKDGLGEAQVRIPAADVRARAIKYDVDQRRHVGGPPVALCAYDNAMRCHVGIYLIRLKGYERSDSPWKLAVDFGTSHTIAAMDERDGSTAPVDLAPELAPSRQQSPLSLHISENWPNVPGRELWRPTYLQKRRSGAEPLIPSEIMSVKPLKQLIAQDIRQWEPLGDCAIPAMELQRSDLPDFVLSGFKWRVSQPRFQESETLLREIYLGMALEILVADMVRTRGLLPKRVDITFTYPLRSAMSAEVRAYMESVHGVLKRSGNDLGCNFEPVGGQGLYSESHAAKGGTARFAEIILVGDLGGGTIDLLISTTEKHGNSHFGEVADSAKIGGDLLLELMARNASDYLPSNGGWNLTDPSACATQLRAWMRARGSLQLFGTRSANQRDDGLELKGFDHASHGNRARQLINRYFRLITDYMARSLVAYVGTDWWPSLTEEDRSRLRIVVQLRGNGWRLWYESEDYMAIQRSMEAWIRERANNLWKYVDMETPSSDKWHLPGTITRPKIDPICNVVDKNLGPDLALEKSYKFPLSDFELLCEGTPDRNVDWFEPLPLRIAEGAEPEFGHIAPPILLGHPDKSPSKISVLEDALIKKINEAIKGGKVRARDTLDAPIASLIWEQAFCSQQLTGGGAATSPPFSLKRMAGRARLRR